MVLPTLSIGFLLLTPVPVLPESQALIYVSPFARNTLLTLLSLFNSYSFFKAHLCVTILGKISHCVICVSTYCVHIFIPGFIYNLVINMCSQVCLLPTLVHALPPDLREETTAWHAMRWNIKIWRHAPTPVNWLQLPRLLPWDGLFLWVEPQGVLDSMVMSAMGQEWKVLALMTVLSNSGICAQ